MARLPLPRFFGMLLAACAMVSPASPAEADALARFYRGYPADALEPIIGPPPESIRVLPPSGPSRWLEPVRLPLESRVRAEWPRNRTYGPLQTGVALWLAHPLVTGLEGGRLLVPVLADVALPVRGVVEMPRQPGRRRVVVLLDASSSANILTLIRAGRQGAERVSILDAERRSLHHLLSALEAEPGTELGIVTYGETTRPLAEPGTPIPEIRRRLERWSSEQPGGVGRTDLVCALEVARDWLREVPEGTSREVVLLTDGDLPHSGRFLQCSQRSKEARQACEARVNDVPCPARHRFRERDGYSDLLQLEGFGRRAKRHLSVYALVFDASRPAHPYRELAGETGGELFRVPSAERLEVALPALVLRRVQGVRARNERTGEETADLLDRATGRFEGTLPLVTGPNDVVLTVEGEHGPVAAYRFRIYSEPGHLDRVLSELRRSNGDLELAVRSYEEERTGASMDRRRLAIEPDPLPASPDAR